MSFRLDLPDIEEISEVADWFELLMLINEFDQISRAQLLDRFVAETGATAQELEPQINFLFMEISRRRRIAGFSYPLIVDDLIVKTNKQPCTEFYKFLLLISIKKSPLRKRRGFKEVDQIFDNIVCEAVKIYFGEGTETLRFGWPPSDGRPKKFTKALEWLSVKTGINVGIGASSPANKDGGVDVVAWKPFSDKRTAFIIALIQCTIQLDWFPKGKDIVDHVWLSKLDTGRFALTSLAIPFIIEKNFDKWDDLRRTVNLIFDRLRLSEVLSRSDISLFGNMIVWNRKEIAKFK